MILAGRTEVLRDERVPGAINNQEHGRASAVAAWRLTPPPDALTKNSSSRCGLGSRFESDN